MSTKRRTILNSQPEQTPRGPNGRPTCRWCKREVPKGRRSYCGDRCVFQWSIRSNPRFARAAVHQRDKGICALCGTDANEAGWHMDHIVPVRDGGGECGLRGLRTLCKPCHRRVTAQQNSERAARRREERA